MRKHQCATCASPCAVPRRTAHPTDWKFGLALGAAMSLVLAVAVTALTALMNQAMAAESPGAERQRELTRFVRQECGFCHGLRLTGGLGTPLTAAALAEKPAEALEATILHGRTGTAMPGWAPHLSESDTRWIVSELLKGFPE
ncbi:MAG: cytochrome c [Betaproteobacteria bacterium]|nr:cytochrome c [Betaproteobacteria bacterium]